MALSAHSTLTLCVEPIAALSRVAEVDQQLEGQTAALLIHLLSAQDHLRSCDIHRITMTP